MNDFDKVKYLELIAEHGLERSAARKLGVPYSTIKKEKAKDPDWQTEIDEALMDFKEFVEETLYDRAMNGTPRSVFNRNGELVAETREMSDVLLVKLAKALDPVKYSEKTQLTGANQGPVEIVLRNVDDSSDQF